MDWDTVWGEILPYVVELVLTIGVGLFAFAKSGVKGWLDSRSEEAKVSTQGKALATAMGYLTDISFAVVARTEQAVLSEQRKALADGKISKEEFRQLTKVAKDAALGEVKRQTLGRITGALGIGESDADQIIEAKLEESVVRIKALKKSAPGPGAASPLPPATIA